MAKQRIVLASSTVGGTSVQSFHALKEATEWHLPDEQGLAGEPPEHREDFKRLLEPAVKGRKEA